MITFLILAILAIIALLLLGTGSIWNANSSIDNLKGEQI